jgi:hypothetical protein
LQGLLGQAGEDPAALELRMGGGIHRPHGHHAVAAGPELPPHEGPKPDDPVTGPSHQHERPAERVPQVLPPEQFGRSPARGARAERRAEQVQDRLQIVVPVRDDIDPGGHQAHLASPGAGSSSRR